MAIAETTRERLDRVVTGMRTERGEFEQDWQEIGRLCLPNRVDILNGTSNSNRSSKRRANTKSHDTAGRIACRRLVNGMATGLTSSSRPWFKLTVRDREMREFQPVKEWLDIVEQEILALFARTNYYDATKMQYADLGTMGVGCTLALEHPEYMATWHHLPVGSYYISLDAGLRVSRLVRKTRPTVENVIELVGGDFSKVSNQVKTAYDKGDYHVIVPCTHVIERNEDDKGRPLSPNIRKPWRSIKWEDGQSDRKILLSERGFDSQPFTAPRWETLGDQVYCDTSPGFDALADMRELQLTARNKGRAMGNLVNPALAAPAGLARTFLTLDPGTINYIDAMSGDAVKPILQTDPRLITELRQDQEWLSRRIDQLFYADLFMSITEMDGIQPRNEQELFFRNEEKLTQLGPVVDRVNIEKLEADVDRAYTILKNLNALPPLPPELEGEPLQIEFISILALAQRAAANSSIERAARFVGFVAGMFPDAALKFDAEQAIDEYAMSGGVNPRIIRSDDLVAELKQQMQQQQQMEQMQQMAPAMQQGAQAAELLSKTQISPDGTTALQQMLGT